MAKKSDLAQAIEDMTEAITAREMEIEAMKIALRMMEERHGKRAQRKPRLVAAG